MLSVLVLFLIAGLCMPSHVQAAAADQPRPTIAADGYEIVEDPTNPAGHSVYTHVRQGAFEAMPTGWGDVRATRGGAGWTDEKRREAQATLAGLVNAETGYTTANEVAWDDARMARQYGPGDTIKIRVKFTRPVIIHEEVKLRIDLSSPVYMDIDTTVHDRPLVNSVTDQPDDGAVYIESVAENGDFSNTRTDNLYVTFVYTVQDGDFTPEGIKMISWHDPFYREIAGRYGRIGGRFSMHEPGGTLQFLRLSDNTIRDNTGPGEAYEGAFVWPVDVLDSGDVAVLDPASVPFTYLGESLLYRRLNDGGTNVYLYSVDTFGADTLVAQIVDGIGARHSKLDPAHPTIGDTVAEQTGAFDIEIKFANYHTEIYAEQPRSNTFGAAEILLSGDDVERADWTISDAAFYGLDAVDPGSYDSTNQEITQETDDHFAGEIKADASYAVYRATITPPDNFAGDVAISIAENAITDLAGNMSKASNTLTVSVNTVEVNIPDATLLAAIKEKLGIADDTGVTPAKMLDLTSLDLSGSDVSDLTGLAHATNLEELDLSDTQVSDISALASLTSLLELSLSGTPIGDEDISHLSGLINLKKLDLSDTQVSDISPLSD